LHAQLEQRLGHPLELVDLFRYPTVAAFAAYLDGTARPAPPVAELSRRDQTLERRRRLRQDGGPGES
jgi:hypothetical protein